MKANGTETVKKAILRWWHGQKPKRNKDEFLADRTQWEEVHDWLANEGYGAVGHDGIKAKVRQLEKHGMFGPESLAAALQTEEERKRNREEYGTSGGEEGFSATVGGIHEHIKAKSRRVLSRQYIDYTEGEVWKNRANRYLDEACSVLGGFRCEMCGTVHGKRHTINVHHNQQPYTLDGLEQDEELLGCCSGLCHQMADIALKIKRGDVDDATANDISRALFANME